MEMLQIIDDVGNMFTDSPEPATLKELQQAFYEGSNGEDIVDQDDIRKACETLCGAMLERKGPDTYGCTAAWIAKREKETAERGWRIYAEHFRKGGK